MFKKFIFKARRAAFRFGFGKSVYLGNNKAICTTIFGHKMLVDTRDMSLSPHLLIDGAWELHLSRILCGLIKPGGIVVDIGANVGWYSLLAAKLVGGGGAVHAFEANPVVASFLNENSMINGYSDRVFVESKAVSDSTGVVDFSLDDIYYCNSSVVNKVRPNKDGKDSLSLIQVPAVSLDEYFSPGRRIDLIKCDAEGSEPDVIKGALRLLDDNKDIILVLEVNGRSKFESRVEMIESLQRLGFGAWRVDVKRWRLVSLSMTNLANDEFYFDPPDIIFRRIA